MNIASFSIKRAIFISSIVLVLMSVGLLSLGRLGVDLFPNVEMPFISVTTIYKGASSEEIENLISKLMEEEISSIAGLKKLSSYNMDSASIIWAQFTLETDVKYAEQQMKDRIANIRGKLPDEIEEPLFQRYDPSSAPVLKLALQAELSPMEIFDCAKEIVKPKIEQIPNVGYVGLIGGTRREIQIELDRNKLNYYELPAVQIANQLNNAGANVPVGIDDRGKTETVYRSIGQFENLGQIENSIISFAGDLNSSIALKSLGRVRDTTEDAKTKAYLYYPERDPDNKITSNPERQPALFMDIYKQSGSNTVEVVDTVIKSIDKINGLIKDKKGHPKLVMIYDAGKPIKSNIDEVKFTILLGILLAVIVVYFFLGNIRSTLITGIAIPNSLLGAFILMYIMGFTVNMMTLMALSLTVGLLIDDAIVVRENIFRKLESGMRSFRAAQIGTREVMLAVIATTMTIVAVFFPIGFLQGMVGKFFKEFGFTVIFAMLISLFDALTVAPLLSGYFAGKPTKAKNILVRSFDKLQNQIDRLYGHAMHYALRHPVQIILFSLFVLFISFGAFAKVKKTFIPESNEGQFLVVIEMPPGTSLTGTDEVAQKIEDKIKSQVKELKYMTSVIGTEQGESNRAVIGVFLVPAKERKSSVTDMKIKIRGLLKEFAYAKPSVNDIVLIGMEYPFWMNLKGDNLKELEDYSAKVVNAIRKVPDLAEVRSSAQGRKTEFHVMLDPSKMQQLGVQPRIAGAELRYHIAGGVVGKLHQNGIEYDIRMRLKPDQRGLKSAFNETRIPNMHMRMIPLRQISGGRETEGSSKLIRENRSRVVQIQANLVPGGAIESATKTAVMLINKECPPPAGIEFEFEGQSEDYKDLSENIKIAMLLSIIFIYFVLASLYESFITPVTIIAALPPALSGAFLGLFITGDMLNVFSMIGIVMLMGLVTKNSILLVDFALEGVRSGMSRKEAILKAGRLRLRPILMTTFAMIAGTFPLALGIGESAQYRSAMGSAIIGGLVVSTLITLLVVPAIFEYIDRFREFIEKKFQPADMEIQMAEELAESEHSLMADEFTKQKKRTVKTKNKKR